MYSEWATGQVNKIKNILNAARADHTEAVKTRIESVQQLGSVVDITKTLFEVSKVCMAGENRILRGNLTNATYRKLPNSRPRLTHSSNKPLSLLRPSLFSTHGSDTRDKSRSVNKRNSQKASFPRSRRNSRTPRSCNKSYSKVLLMLRVCNFSPLIFDKY